MEYIYSVERIGIKKGIQQGTIKLLSRFIARRFRVSPVSVHPGKGRTFGYAFPGRTLERFGMEVQKAATYSIPIVNKRGIEEGVS